jgi:pimeloyl-ACP methyl ester carboxylesterase
VRSWVFGVALAVAMSAYAMTAHAENCATLVDVKIPHVTVTSAAEVATAPETKIPYCRIRAVAKPSTDSDIRFELWIPLGSAWNGKFEQVGNGGFAGMIPTHYMARPLSLGYAVAGTDDGHESADSTDASWALNHEEKVTDYGWRAISETTLASKRLLRAFKSRTPAKSYFIGCSDGGREALLMAQRFPQYFDGVVAGAPAYAMTRLLTGGALRSAQVNSPDGHLSAAKLALLQAAALKSCGDGARYLQDPRQCHPDLAALQCAAADQDTCLTAAQIATAKALYGDVQDPVRGVLYGVLPGAEAVKGSWDAWYMGTGDGKPGAGVEFTRSYLANLVKRDPNFDPAMVTKDELARSELHYAPIMDATDPDLSAFKARGGKLIQFHGWNDPGIAPGYSLDYFARVKATMGPVDDFYRLYMVPGMLHCAGGDAPTAVDWQAAIEAWVEQGRAPGVLTAGGAGGATQAIPPFVR